MSSDIQDLAQDKLDAEKDRIRAEIDDFESLISSYEDQVRALWDRCHALDRASRAISSLDDESVEAAINDAIGVKTPRMIEIEQMSKRGLSWDDWKLLNEEYETSAEDHVEAAAVDRILELAS